MTDTLQKRSDAALADASDDQIIEAVAEADVISLLAALALITGDTSLIPTDLRPDRNPLVENAGLTGDQMSQARGRAVSTLRAIRDGDITIGAADTGTLPALMEFLAGPADDQLLAFLTDHLGLTGDPDRPRWTIDEVAPGTEFPVVVIGAGMSGLLIAFRLKQAGIECTIIERESDVGGTWLLNTYPGCRVDGPSHQYSYSFWRSSEWPSYYSPQPLLLEYWQRFADEHDLRRLIRFSTSVEEAVFDEDTQQWRVRVSGPDGSTESFDARAVISAVGQLNRPALPDIQCRETFTGAAFHSAAWDSGIDLTGKRVAVIGTGASAIQIVPEIAETVGQLYVFQRSAPWLASTPNFREAFPDGLAWLLRSVPMYDKMYRFWQFVQFIEGVLPYAQYDPEWQSDGGSGSELNAGLREALIETYREQLPEGSEMLDALIPDYPPIAKRMLRDDGSWISALRRDNVSLITDGIERINARSITVAGGTDIDIDVIIYATGFQASDFLGEITVSGVGGESLGDYWNGDAKAYLGITVPHFPNLFVMYGPNTNIVVNGSIIFFSECQAHYISECVHRLLADGHRSLEVRQDVLDDFVDDVDAGNSRYVWGAPGASSWYKNKTGRVSQNWPHSLVEYWDRTRNPAVGDYIFR